MIVGFTLFSPTRLYIYVGFAVRLCATSAVRAYLLPQHSRPSISLGTDGVHRKVGCPRITNTTYASTGQIWYSAISTYGVGTVLVGDVGLRHTQLRGVHVLSHADNDNRSR